MENMLGNTLGTHWELEGNIVGTHWEPGKIDPKKSFFHPPKLKRGKTKKQKKQGTLSGPSPLAT